MEALLGALLFRLRRHEESEAVLRRVIAAAPTFAKPAEDLGDLLLHTGRAAEALPFLERATRLDPALGNAWHGLGRALVLLGRDQEAGAAFEKCFALSPERRLMALAAEHQKSGRLQDAELTCRRVLRDNPRNVDALRLLAQFAAGAGHADDAEAMLAEALRIAPDYSLARLDLGRLLEDQDRFAEALDCFDRVLALEPGQPLAHLHRAATLAQASFTREAVAAYRDCLAIQPTNAGALLGLGHVLNAMGDSEGAVASYLACIDAAPGSGHAYWSLANLKTYRFDDATLADMEKRAAEQGDNRESEANFLFAIAKAWEDRGDYERAWDRYCRGNETHRAGVTYDPARTEAVNDRIVATFTPELFASMRSAGNPDPAPIFILGLPRSGSTLLEQILASHPAVRENTAELPYVGRLATSLGSNRAGGEGYPEAGARAGAREPRGARRAVPRACARAPAVERAALSSTRCRTTSRTSA